MAAERCVARWVAAIWSIGATLGLTSTTTRAAPGCDAIIYFDANFGGENREVYGDERFVGPHWNDQISSIRIRAGDWIFYRDADYGGDVLRFGPGSYPTVPPGWNDQISSLQCVGSGGGGPGDIGGDTYVYEGQTYGWYDEGWNGPGFYIVGLQTARGRGFGGRDGVHGWRHHERRERDGRDHHDDGGHGRDGRGDRPSGSLPLGPPGHPPPSSGFHPGPGRVHPPPGRPRPGVRPPPRPGGGHPSGRPHPGGRHPSPHRGGGGHPPPHRHR